MARKSQSKKSRHSKRSRSVKRGGAVRMPLEYYGTDSGRYFAANDPAMADGNSAYGKFIAVSQGVPSVDGMVGPNVGPYMGASSCTQTGGKRRRSHRKSGRSKRRSHSKGGSKHRRSHRRRHSRK
jgi:hypothetical protein